MVTTGAALTLIGLAGWPSTSRAYVAPDPQTKIIQGYCNQDRFQRHLLMRLSIDPVMVVFDRKSVLRRK